MSSFSEKKCKPCSGETEKLSAAEAQSMVKALQNWTLNEAATEIEKEYKFKNFFHTMGFMNAVAYLANQEGHHPDVKLGYNYCTIKFTTHAIQGLSENDFIIAAKVDRLG